MATKPTKKRHAGVAKGGRGATRGRTVDEEAKERAERVKGRQDCSGPGAMARKVVRDEGILAGHHLGRTTAALAREWKVSQRQVQRVVKQAEGRQSALDTPPMQIVERALGSYEAQVEIWLAVATGALEEGNYNAAVAALKGHADAVERYRKTLGQLGKLPKNLELFKVEAELTQLGNLVLNTLTAVCDGEMTAEQGHARVQELVLKRELPVITSTARDV